MVQFSTRVPRISIEFLRTNENYNFGDSLYCYEHILQQIDSIKLRIFRSLRRNKVSYNGNTELDTHFSIHRERALLFRIYSRRGAF